MAVENEVMLLRAAGHTIQSHIVSNDTITGIESKVRTFIETTYNRQAKQSLAEHIIAFHPDIVHVHNFFPLLTPSIYDACIDARIPIVQTLHNYRTICASALLMRDNKICEKCINGSPYWGAWHRCYRNSLFGSLAVARMIETHQTCGTWQNKVDRFIALTEFGRKKFVQAGFPAKRIAVKPNFAEDPGKLNLENRNGALFVGRLSEEKGIATLIKAWQSLDYPLRIAGDGPLLNTLMAAAPAHIEFLGRVGRADVLKEMSKSAFLIMPSICYEGFPMTIVEAFSCGVPVLASRLGSMAEIVRDGETGLLFSPNEPEELAQAVSSAIANPLALSKMGLSARKTYLNCYTPASNLRQLEQAYETVLRQ